MELAFVTALGVGGATIIGVLIGFLFQKIPHEFNDVILGFAAGIMFAAAVIGLIIPSLEEGNIWVTLAGILAGVPKLRVFFIASFTGIIEVVGTIIGFGAVSIATAILPFALAFAGGTMVYVVSDEMIPETHSHGYERQATYALILGFMTMLLMDHYIGG